MNVSNTLIEVLMLITLHAVRNTNVDNLQVEIINPTNADVVHGECNNKLHIDYGYNSVVVEKLVSVGKRLHAITENAVYTVGNGVYTYTEFFNDPGLKSRFKVGNIDATCSDKIIEYSVEGTTLLRLSQDDTTLRVEFLV